jgi:hypothetical protein
MYIRQLKHMSGKIYVQVIDKSSDVYKVVKSFGSGSESSQVKSLIVKAQN